MDSDRFDDLVRSLTAVSSRRAAMRLVIGGALGSFLAVADGEAKKKGKGKKKKKKKKPPCPTACCADRDCGARNRCVQGQCVTGQGTCAAGATSCAFGDIPCNGRAGCKCWVAAAGETRCGMIPVGIQCGQCSTDAQCAGFGPGAFCVTDTAGVLTNCSCGTAGQGFCIVPCDRVCPPTGCCVNADCGTGQMCSQGQCLTGPGTCQTGQDLCGASGGGGVACNSNANCDCFASVDSGTRCGGAFAGACGACAKDDDCAGHGAGAFCTGGTGCCPGGGRRCVLPCPT